MATIIGTRNYTYGAGDKENRQIQFCRNDDLVNTIEARVFILNPDDRIGDLISTVLGENISVRTTFSATYSEEKLLRELTLQQQKLIMDSLQHRKITVMNGGSKFVPSKLIININ